MTKKILLVLFAVLLFLSGCKYSDYLEPENRSIVTCLYVYGSEDNIKVILETVKSENERGEESYKPLYLKGSGEDFNDALRNAQLNFLNEFSLYHCPLIIFEENLYKSSSKGILMQILNNYQISIAANVLLSENLLNNIENKKDDEFLGYQIADVIELKEVKTTLISVLNQDNTPKKLTINKNNNYNIAE